MAAPKKSAEPIIEPDLPIVDPHHHLWILTSEILDAVGQAGSPMVEVMRNNQKYLLEELLADINTGHNIIATVFSECHSMYRADGPDAMKCVGEVEFVNGVAAMAASGTFGPVKACAGIVGSADLMLGEAVAEVLQAQIQAGGGRFCGIRYLVGQDPDPELRNYGGIETPHVMADKRYRAGFKQLHKHGLSADQWVFEPQLPEVTELARAFPETSIVLNHVGTPVGVGSYAGKLEERFPIWRDNIRTLAKCENVTVKLGGLAMATCAFPSFTAKTPVPSTQLAAEWKPYIETCIEAFGVNRCMFESNFPVDSGPCTYPVIWNAFKHLAAGASKDEKTALFSGTAKRVYRLDI